MKNKLVFKKLDLKENIYILILIMIIGGIFGFIYETIFYKIDLGYFVKRGTTYGPWIPIYAFGSLFITIFTYKYKDKKYKVFLYNIFITGLLEYITGFILDKYFNLRLWNYNNEILNFGNINGYICLRSILFFGLSSLFLIYIVIPKILKFSSSISKTKLKIISITLLVLFIFDMVVYRIIN